MASAELDVLKRQGKPCTGYTQGAGEFVSLGPYDHDIFEHNPKFNLEAQFVRRKLEL